MAWYEDWFDSDAYELVYRERDLDDARRLLDLVERAVSPAPDARVLDVACGRGRHSLLLAQRGYRVTGVDLSENAVRTARRRADAAGLALGSESGAGVDFRVADMRALPDGPAFEAAFDGAVNLFTSFGYFDTEAEHQQAIDEMARALRPGGWLVQDFLNAAYAAAALVPEDEREADGVTIRQRRWLSNGDAGRRINKAIELCCYDHADGEPDTYTFRESVRLLELEDFQRMYAHAGLALVETFGDYDGGPHTPESPRLILHARRADG